jgi:hypothetical protein
MSNSQLFLSFIFTIALSAGAMSLCGHMYYNNKLKRIVAFINKSYNLERISKDINTSFIVLFVLIVFMCIVFVFIVTMYGNALHQEMGRIQRFFWSLNTGVIFFVPTTVIMSIIRSRKYRKSGEFAMAIIIQMIPLALFLLAIINNILIGLMAGLIISI